MGENELLDVLAPYPVALACFTKYIQWFAAQPAGDVADNDLVLALKEREAWRLTCLEQCLGRACEILELPVPRFRSALGFNNDLLSPDPQKVHDVLSEPITVITLAESGFGGIRKLPRFIKEQGQRTPCADFAEERKGVKYAIEVKTIRVENNPPPQPGIMMGDSMKPSWWREMFRENVITKIEDKNKLCIQQLTNAQRRFGCDSNILALSYRRLGPSTLMSVEGFEQELMAVLVSHPVINHILLKPNFDPAFFWPPLDS